MTKTFLTTFLLSVLYSVAQPANSQHDGPHSNGDKKPSPKKMMRALDTDGDGLISYGEFQLLDKRRGADRWDHADSDGDGVGDDADVLPDLKLYHSYSQIFTQLILI